MSSRLTPTRPPCAIEGGRITIEGADLSMDRPDLPEVRVGDLPARVVRASARSVAVLVPRLAENGPAAVRIAGVDTAVVEVAAPLATGLHQVDNPVFDRDGNLYVTYSGTRGQQVPVSIFRVLPNGTRETFSSGIVNPTSMVFGPDGELYVSSRFDGTVYRVAPDGSFEPVASGLGIACGLAFDGHGHLFVGDRSGTIFRLDSAGRAESFASLPSSIAAFHLAFGPDESLYVSSPTLASYDSIYRIDSSGRAVAHYSGFGRPQGVAFDSSGTLFVVEALAGSSGLYRLPATGAPELVLAGPGLVGVAFDQRGGVVVCSNDTAYRAVRSGF
jgi:sugar lactone lactonase YvrE